MANPAPILGTLELGSNSIINCQSVIQADGIDLMSLEVGKTGELLLSIELYDSARTHIAKLRRNAWAFAQPRFDVETNPRSLRLTDRSTGETVVAAEIVGPNHIRVTELQCYTPHGRLIEVKRVPAIGGPIALIVGGVTMIGNTIHGAGHALSIGTNAVGLAIT